MKCIGPRQNQKARPKKTVMTVMSCVFGFVGADLGLQQLGMTCIVNVNIYNIYI